MKMASRLIDLISKKPNCMCSTLFLLVAKSKFARAAHFFVFPLPLSCTTTTLFCTTKTSNFLVTPYFYGGSVVCVYPIFCFLCSCLLLFFTAAHFHLAGRQYFSFSHCRFQFPCFSPNEIRLPCFQPGGGGYCHIMDYIGMCCCEGYGFQAVYFRIGYISRVVTKFQVAG